MQKKVCLVTGVGDGTGASIVRRFAKEGYRVAMLARNKERLAKLEKELMAVFLAGQDDVGQGPR